MAKLQRNYILTLQDFEYNTVTIKPPFTIDFDVLRNPLSSTCTANIRIYNLGESTRNRLYKDQTSIHIYKSCELKAGYGSEMPTIFGGNILKCMSKREGTDYITTVEIYDGQYALMNGYTSTVIASGTSKQNAIEQLMRDLPNINKRVIGNYEGEITRSNSVVGNTAELLKQFTNGGFFIDTETAYALQDSECVNGVINVINSRSGLLGSPQREDGVFTFDMIFEPRIKMCQYVELQSQTERIFNGQFKVISIHHKGMISESVSGQVITTLKLWYGPGALDVITGAIR